MSEKRVLFLRANPVNPDSRVEKEVNTLLANGYKVDVLAWDRSRNYKIKQENLQLTNSIGVIYRVGIKSAYGNGIKNIFNLGKFQLEIIKFLKKNKYDIIHACDFDTAFTAYHMTKKEHSIFIYDIFDFYVESMKVPEILRGIILKKDLSIINHADATIICSEKRKEQIAKANPKRLVVIHNTPDFSLSNNRVQLNENKIKIAYFGILPEQGRMLEELCRIVAMDKTYELHMGGFGLFENKAKEYAEKHDNIFFYGKVAYNDVLNIERSCDIITAIYDPLVSNHVYAAPNKFYEALMLGKPLIMVANTGMSDIVEEYKIGELITYDQNGLQAGLEKLCSNRESWTQISKRMNALYNDKYSWLIMSERLLELYRNFK